MRSLFRLLTSGSSGGADDKAPPASYVPAVCERWLGDRARVRWARERLGSNAYDRGADQRVGQLFCDVIGAWAQDLAAQGVSDRTDQRAAIEQAGIEEWTAAMERYGAPAS